MSAILRHIDSLERYAVHHGARLARSELPDAVHGRVAEGLITLHARLSPEQELLALVHELAHWLAHRSECLNAPRLASTVYEYEAEAVEALVMARLGLAPADPDALPGEESVRVNPGATEAARMPYRASSFAHTTAIDSTPAFAAL
jgi:hypothetical protein